ncbi:hypothetical protein JCM6882_008132 [Rhodosporidiobolus microsporus]
MSSSDTEVDPYSLPATHKQATAVLAPCAIGWQCGLILFGLYVRLHAEYVKSAHYKRAVWQVKAVLWAVFFFLLVHTALCVTEITVYVSAVDRTFGQIVYGYEFESFPPLSAGLVAAPVQALLMCRTALLLRRKVIRWLFISVTSLFILFSLTCSIMACASNLMVHAGTADRILPLEWAKIMSGFLWSAAAIDILISVALAATLKARVAGFNEKTDSLLHRLIVSALQTASYTAVLSIAGAICSVAFDAASLYGSVAYAFWSQLPACYGLSLYTTLSTRRTVEEYIGTSLPLPGSAQHDLSTPPGALGYGTGSRLDMRPAAGGGTGGAAGGGRLAGLRMEERLSWRGGGGTDSGMGRTGGDPEKRRSPGWEGGGLLKGDLEDEASV